MVQHNFNAKLSGMAHLSLSFVRVTSRLSVKSERSLVISPSFYLKIIMKENRGAHAPVGIISIIKAISTNASDGRSWTHLDVFVRFAEL